MAGSGREVEACVQAWVSGRVQGVGFRWRAVERASALGVRGWVRNLADGRVELWLEGERRAVRAMLAWLEGGPSWARVERVDTAEAEPEGHASFEVRPSARGA